MIVNPQIDGSVAVADYSDQVIPQFRGNPFLEALPPILDPSSAMQLMAYYPEYGASMRELEPSYRDQLASSLSSLRIPVGIHLELEKRISRLIRWGYVSRNPIERTFQAEIDQRVGALRVHGAGHSLRISSAFVPADLACETTGLTFLGITGIGKTAAMNMVLRLFPQLIVHTAYGGEPFLRTQVVWLHLQCPSNGSILTLCHNFFEAMDAVHAAVPIPTDYKRDYVSTRASIERLIPSMARLASQHGLGVLVLDEVQDLRPRGADAMLSFLVQLVNTIKVPVIMVGGFDALPLLAQQFRQARRGSTEGDFVVGRAEKGAAWRLFCERLWTYQYTKHESPLTDAIVDVLYEESQGITQYLVGLYKLAQQRAITTGAERVTPRLIRDVARDSFVEARPVLRALHRGDWDFLKERRDVVLPLGFEGIPFLSGDLVQARDSKSHNMIPPELFPASGEKEGGVAKGDDAGAFAHREKSVEVSSSSSDAVSSALEALSASSSPGGLQADDEVAPAQLNQKNGTAQEEAGQAGSFASNLLPDVVQRGGEAEDAHSVLEAKGLIRGVHWKRLTDGASQESDRKFGE